MRYIYRFDGFRFGRKLLLLLTTNMVWKWMKIVDFLQMHLDFFQIYLFFFNHFKSPFKFIHWIDRIKKIACNWMQKLPLTQCNSAHFKQPHNFYVILCVCVCMLRFLEEIKNFPNLLHHSNKFNVAIHSQTSKLYVQMMQPTWTYANIFCRTASNTQCRYVRNKFNKMKREKIQRHINDLTK